MVVFSFGSFISVSWWRRLGGPAADQEDFDMNDAAEVFRQVFGDSRDYLELIEHLARSASSSSCKQQWRRHAEEIKAEMRKENFSVETKSLDGSQSMATRRTVEDDSWK